MPCLSFPSFPSVRTQTKSATATSLAILIGIGDAGRSRSRRGGGAGVQIRSIKSSRVDETRQGRIEMASAARSSIARALRRVGSQQLQPQSHGMATSSAPKRKVAVLGAAGGIGQPLGLLMKLNPLVTHLSLYDIVGTPGVAADISHVNTPAEVDGYAGEADLGKALDGADLVIIPAGIPRKPGMTRDDLFKINAGIVKSLVEGVAKFCPEAILAVISNPVNSTVPIAAEVLKLAGTYNPKKLFGVTTLDVVRARTFYAAKKGLNVRDVDVPVVGGHAGITILPLFSQATPRRPIGDDEREALTKRTQDGGTEVVTAKAGKGSATLSMAYAGALFAEAALKGLNGEKRIVECTYVQSSLIPDLPFFSSKVRLGPQGVEEIIPLGTLSEYENRKLEELKSELLGSINKGIDFVKQS